MNIQIYIFIFLCKIAENMIATLRIIIINNNRKFLGAILQFTNTLIWILGTSLVIVDIQKDIFKILVFAFGSLIGSYLGSKIEEKLSLGDNIIICMSSKPIDVQIRKQGYAVTTVLGKGMVEDKNILFIVIPRYKNNDLFKLIEKLDKKAAIICEKTNIIQGIYK